MAYVVTDDCIKCKYAECVTVCPVDCFREGANMLVIDQEQCIDCGSCEPICPGHAILPAIDDAGGRWADFNRQYASLWPEATALDRPATPEDADSWNGVVNKLAQHFDPAPGRT
ncbi:4Fe-4S binding protein [Bradyrhizobium cenepequi]